MKRGAPLDAKGAEKQRSAQGLSRTLLLRHLCAAHAQHVAITLSFGKTISAEDAQYQEVLELAGAQGQPHFLFFVPRAAHAVHFLNSFPFFPPARDRG